MTPASGHSNKPRFGQGTASMEHAVTIGIIVLAVVLAGFGMRQVATSGFGRQNEDDTAKQSLSDVPAKGHGLALGLTLIGGSLVLVVLQCARLMLRHRNAAEQSTPQLPRDLRASFVAKRQSILHSLSKNVPTLLRGRLLVRYLMTEQVIRVTPDLSAERLRTLMEQKRVRHLVVCAPDGRMLGVISDRDLFSRSGKHACDFMTTNPLTVSPNAEVSPAITLMLEKHISCLPVVECDVLKGMLTSTDLMLALQCNIRLIEQLAQQLTPKSADDTTSDDSLPPKEELELAGHRS